MKKVRLAVGVTGMLPAIGLMTQATAEAAAHHPVAKGKAVSLAALDHAPAVAFNTCDGSRRVSTGSNNSNMHFWWKPEGTTKVCIGTVVRTVNALGNPAGIGAASYVRYRFFSANHPLMSPVYSHKSYGNCSAFGSCKVTFNNGVHESFGPKPLRVCTAIVAPHETYGTECITVG